MNNNIIQQIDENIYYYNTEINYLKKRISEIMMIINIHNTDNFIRKELSNHKNTLDKYESILFELRCKKHDISNNVSVDTQDVKRLLGKRKH